MNDEIGKLRRLARAANRYERTAYESADRYDFHAIHGAKNALTQVENEALVILRDAVDAADDLGPGLTLVEASGGTTRGWLEALLLDRALETLPDAPER
jgi:replicative DNA helicase